MQSEGVGCSALGVYFPGVQGWHAVAAVLGETWPGAHFVHTSLMSLKSVCLGRGGAGEGK